MGFVTYKRNSAGGCDFDLLISAFSSTEIYKFYLFKKIAKLFLHPIYVDLLR